MSYLTESLHWQAEFRSAIYYVLLFLTGAVISSNLATVGGLLIFALLATWSHGASIDVQSKTLFSYFRSCGNWRLRFGPYSILCF